MINYCDKNTINHFLIALAMLFFASSLNAENNLPHSGQPASDVLMSYDLWGNPTPVGGVTNGGATSHSTW